MNHSLVFCSDCGTLLDPPSGTEEFVTCDCCSNSISAKAFEHIKVTTQSRVGTFTDRPKESVEIANVHEGATINEKCPKCDAAQMVFHTAQLRSADEGQTIFYKCVVCGHKYSVNS